MLIRCTWLLRRTTFSIPLLSSLTAMVLACSAKLVDRNWWIRLEDVRNKGHDMQHWITALRCTHAATQLFELSCSGHTS